MYQLIFNLLVAAALGCIIGLEREIQGKFAGLKTHLCIVVLTLIERVAYNIYYSKKDKEDLPL